SLSNGGLPLRPVLLMHRLLSLFQTKCWIGRLSSSGPTFLNISSQLSSTDQGKSFFNNELEYMPSIRKVSSILASSGISGPESSAFIFSSSIRSCSLCFLTSFSWDKSWVVLSRLLARTQPSAGYLLIVAIILTATFPGSSSALFQK